MPNFCSIEGCDKPHKAKGFCGRHYARVKRRGSIELPAKEARKCIILGCNRRHWAKGLCEKHYQEKARREKGIKARFATSTKSLEGEEWRDIPGVEGYQASNYGRIKSLARPLSYQDGRKRRAHEHILRAAESGGYLQVRLPASSTGKKRGGTLKVHRLVALAFHPNPEHLPCINHKDGNKTNNRSDNLEWCTFSQNSFHAKYVLGRKMKLDCIPIRCVETGRVFPSIRMAGRKTGVNPSDISRAITGKEGRKTAGGLHWEKI